MSGGTLEVRAGAVQRLGSTQVTPDDIDGVSGVLLQPIAVVALAEVLLAGAKHEPFDVFGFWKLG